MKRSALWLSRKRSWKGCERSRPIRKPLPIVGDRFQKACIRSSREISQLRKEPVAMKMKRFLPLLLLPTLVACQTANQSGQSAVAGAQAHLEAGKEQAEATLTQAEAAATGRTYIEMLDPVGDDDGPGTYIYPTDPVYTAGSFDITKFEVEDKGDHVEFRVTVNAKIEDPWDSRAWQGNGFSVQMAQIYIDMDHQPESGIRQALPGMNVTFVPESYWERCIIISPQGPNRVNSEINEKAAQWK
ncbi:MAG: hypothetical protein D6812_01035, partial [Deltaproteobacteria bacterium]